MAFDILCRMILERKNYLQYEQQMLILIKAFRIGNYNDQEIISEENCRNQVRVDLLIVKKIGLFKHLQNQFDNSSKDFYVQVAEAIPKDNNFLHLVNQFLQRQIDLNNIFSPKINTVYYVEKQLIKQYYDFILDNLLEDIINRNQKTTLKIFWRFTLRLKQQAMKKFSLKLKKIIQGMKKYFTQPNNTKQDLFKLIKFRQSLFSVTDQCFDKNRNIVKLIYNTFQEVLYEEEKHYLNLVLREILVEKKEQQAKISTKSEMEVFLDNKKSNDQFILFRITPSKENFIKQFQIRFSRWILSKGFQIRSLAIQQKMIQQMKRQVGNNLVKKLDRMLNDIWRNNKMHYHEKIMKNGTHMKCIFLSNDWPVNFSLVFNISDEFYNMLNQFQSQFKQSIENKQKQIKWVNEIGLITLKINGIESIFNQIQASIIVLLDKSIRPLRKQQIQASLNICDLNREKKQAMNVQAFSSQVFLYGILTNLVSHNILSYNPGPQTYDINDQNITPYKFLKTMNQKDFQNHHLKRVQAQKDNSVLIQAAIVKILKKRKNMQRSDITLYIEQSIKNFKPSFQQITKAFQTLQNRQFIQINRNKGIISYVE